MLRRSLGIHLYTPLIANVQPAGLPIPVIRQLGRDTSHVPTGVEYPRAGQFGDGTGHRRPVKRYV